MTTTQTKNSTADLPLVAYMSMEIALEPGIPTYSGGLGVLAGDTLRSAADLGLSVVAVTLVHRKGYFRQTLDSRGRQREHDDRWRPIDHLDPLEARVSIPLNGRTVEISAWRYEIRGQRGHVLPVFLLDTDLTENSRADRRLTDNLYGGDDEIRLCQEAVLGLGGVAMLEALGLGSVDRYHLNEGHAALAALPILEEALSSGDEPDLVRAVESLQKRCVFTTHTPVPAGHDRFPIELVERVLGRKRKLQLESLGVEEELNLTDLALESSRFVNGVAMRHGEVSQGMFPHYPIRSITNGVYPATWAAPSFQDLFDEHIPHWRSDPFSLRYAVGIPADEIWRAHLSAKRALLETVRRETDLALDPEVLTLGFARRATSYKRATLLFNDLERLRSVVKQRGPLQVVFAGKAHPRDHEGKELIREIFRAGKKLGKRMSVVYLPGYDMRVGALMCAGSDVWLNTPIPPLEASGTSGMKAALNGVPSLSLLDGWWVEGCIEGVTGWAIGADGDGAELPAQDRDRLHAAELYRKLEEGVLPCYYDSPARFRSIMQHCIALNGSFFNTHRMVIQYLYEAYLAVDDPTRRR